MGSSDVFETADDGVKIGNFVELSDKIEYLDLKSAMKIQKEYSPRLLDL